MHSDSALAAAGFQMPPDQTEIERRYQAMKFAVDLADGFATDVSEVVDNAEAILAFLGGKPQPTRAS